MLDLRTIPFGFRIMYHRMAAKLTQAQLAERCGLSSGGVWKLEKGKTRPRVDSAERIAAALGVNLDELLFQVEVAPPPKGRPRLKPRLKPREKPALVRPQTGLRDAVIAALRQYGPCTTMECWSLVCDMKPELAEGLMYSRVASELWTLWKAEKIVQMWRGCYDAIREPAPEPTAENMP